VVRTFPALDFTLVAELSRNHRVETPCQGTAAIVRTVWVRSRCDPSRVLTAHQVALLRHLAWGKRVEAISLSFGVKVGTVYEQLQDLRVRLAARSNPELVRLAILHGFIAAGDA
jgi:DNA-binding NarL/FixJ family response regulator